MLGPKRILHSNTVSFANLHNLTVQNLKCRKNFSKFLFGQTEQGSHLESTIKQKQTSNQRELLPVQTIHIPDTRVTLTWEVEEQQESPCLSRREHLLSRQKSASNQIQCCLFEEKSPNQRQFRPPKRFPIREHFRAKSHIEADALHQHSLQP